MGQSLVRRPYADRRPRPFHGASIRPVVPTAHADGHENMPLKCESRRLLRVTQCGKWNLPPGTPRQDLLQDPLRQLTSIKATSVPKCLMVGMKVYHAELSLVSTFGVDRREHSRD